jgi:hypothetical protein
LTAQDTSGGSTDADASEPTVAPINRFDSGHRADTTHTGKASACRINATIPFPAMGSVIVEKSKIF